MDQDQSMELIIHRLAREALRKQRTEAKGADRELLDELETLSTEVKALLEQLPGDKKCMLEMYIEKLQLLSERGGDYLYFQGAKDCMELFGKLEQAREKK